MLRLKNICLEHTLFKCNLATKMLKKKKGRQKEWILIQGFILQNSLMYGDKYKICHEKNASV